MAMNKRQQARNERALNLLREDTTTGNDRCADCGDKDNSWASWNLGVFLCMRCASLHRRLGTHITKVKSTAMDSWSVDEVENMKKTGNKASNAKFNPRSVKPQLPVDADEVLGVMERYLRQKYEQKAFMTGAAPSRQQRQHTGSTSTNSDEPPPLPAKPARRFFGLRSATAPLSRRNTDRSPPVSPGLGGFEGDASPPRSNKQSRVFGSNIGSSSSVDFDAKLAQLREMGFRDERRNSAVLKGLSGNIDKAIETLVRLGEGSRSPNRTGSPAVPPKDDPPVGISISKTRQVASPLSQTPAAVTSTNPFDNITPVAAPQQQQPPASLQQMNQQPRSFTTPNAYNPFMQPQQALQPSLNQSFQALNLAQPQQQQPLFPNTTGGQTLHQSNPYAQTYTPPPLPSHSNSFPLANHTAVQQSLQQPVQPFAHNPFLRQTRSQVFTPSSNSNPFGLAPPQIQQQQPTSETPVSQQPSTYPLYQQPFQQQAQQQQPVQQPAQKQQQSFQQPAQQPTQQQPQPSFSPQPQTNPFGRPQQPQSYQQSYQQPFQPQQQQTAYQQPQQMPMRHDKNSIMALFSQPTTAFAQPAALGASEPAPEFNAPQRSVTMPVTGSHNPFAQSTLAPVAENGEAVQVNGQLHYTAAPAANGGPFASLGPAAGGARNISAGSRESVDFMGQMMNGRHSPDAFAGLSSRYA